MERSLSVLQKATAADVCTDPYPFIVVPNALPDDLYEELAASYPAPELMGLDMRRNNSRWDYPARTVATNRKLPKIWRDFIAYHASQAFFDEIADIFYDAIHALYPERFPTRQSLTEFRAGIRRLNSFPGSDILMDALISGNTPVKQASSVRTSHLDKGDKLYSGLFYMRPDGYSAVGGDLTISRFKPDIAGSPDRFKLYRGAYVEDSELEVVKTITYDKNLLVLFINSLESIHGVTVREPSSDSRIFVNLVGVIDPPLYEQEKDGVTAHYVSPDHVTGRRAFRNRIRPAIRRFFVRTLDLRP